MNLNFGTRLDVVSYIILLLSFRVREERPEHVSVQRSISAVQPDSDRSFHNSTIMAPGSRIVFSNLYPIGGVFTLNHHRSMGVSYK